VLVAIVERVVVVEVFVLLVPLVLTIEIDVKSIEDEVFVVLAFFTIGETVAKEEVFAMRD
jgi:hypothetical protein